MHLPMRDDCQTYWGSHGCRFEAGHEGACECSCCDCPDDQACEPGCVAKPPYYGPETRFYGDDAAARRLPMVDGWGVV